MLSTNSHISLTTFRGIPATISRWRVCDYKWIMVLPALILLSIFTPILAETIVAGDVYGVWDLDGSPYMVTDTVLVPEDSILYIEPGVVVEFFGQTETHRFPLFVEGALIAVGTAEDSIHFLSDQEGLAGIIGGELGNNSRIYLEYCFIDTLGDHIDSHGGEFTARNSVFLAPFGESIRMFNDTADTLENCNFIGCAGIDCGGIYFNGSDSGVITSCQMDDAAIGVVWSNVRIENSVFRSLDVTGSAIELENSICHNGLVADLSSCEIRGNVIGTNPHELYWATFIDVLGTFIFADNSVTALNVYSDTDTHIINNIIGKGFQTNLLRLQLISDWNTYIYGNEIHSIQDGISVLADSSFIQNNTFVCTQSALHLNTSYSMVENNIFVGDGNARAIFSFGDDVSIQYNCSYMISDFYNIDIGNHTNIFADPQFEGGELFSYNLRVNSSCIDAGNPDGPLDPDNTISDLGANYFDQSIDHPPVLTSDLDITASRHETFRYLVQAIDDNDIMTFDFHNLPNWIRISDELDYVENARTLLGTIPEDLDSFVVSMRVSDGMGQFDEETARISVISEFPLKGTISGRLESQYSPYFVVDRATVPAGDTLIIE